MKYLETVWPQAIEVAHNNYKSRINLGNKQLQANLRKILINIEQKSEERTQLQIQRQKLEQELDEVTLIMNSDIKENENDQSQYLQNGQSQIKKFEAKIVKLREAEAVERKQFESRRLEIIG